jgi:hypothetical protein
VRARLAHTGSRSDEFAMQFLERRVSAVEEAMIQRSIEDRLISKLNKMLQRLDVLSLNIVLPFLRCERSEVALG